MSPKDRKSESPDYGEIGLPDFRSFGLVVKKCNETT